MLSSGSPGTISREHPLSPDQLGALLIRTSVDLFTIHIRAKRHLPIAPERIKLYRSLT